LARLSLSQVNLQRITSHLPFYLFFSIPMHSVLNYLPAAVIFAI